MNCTTPITEHKIENNSDKTAVPHIKMTALNEDLKKRAALYDIKTIVLSSDRNSKSNSLRQAFDQPESLREFKLEFVELLGIILNWEFNYWNLPNNRNSEEFNCLKD